MDWRKIKSILIIALLITNAILLYFIVTAKEEETIMDDATKLTLVKSIISEKNIVNKVEHPPQKNEVPALDVSYQSYHLPDLAKVVLGGNFKKDGDHYFNGKYILDVIDDVMILKLPELKVENKAFPTLDNALTIAEDFIENKLKYDADYTLIEKRMASEGIILTFGQVYKGYFIHNTYMKVIVRTDGVATFERKWMEVLPIENTNIKIMPYTKALFLALDKLEHQAKDKPLSIEAVSIDYQLVKTIFNTDVRSGGALPFYRFVLSTGESILVPALSEQ